jgi:hypothetical protein
MSAPGDPGAHVANRVLIERRSARGWGRSRLAAQFERVALSMGFPVPSREAIEKAIYRHETGRSAVTDDMYRQLYCTVYDANAPMTFSVTSRRSVRPTARGSSD